MQIISPNARGVDNVDFNLEHTMVRCIIELRNVITNSLSAQISANPVKTKIFFKRAFTRWMFNIVRKGKNPFTDDITVKDMVVDDDVSYFFNKNPGVAGDAANIDWSDIDEYLKQISKLRNDIYEGYGNDCQDTFQKTMDNSRVVYTYHHRFTGQVESYQMTRSQWEHAAAVYQGDPALMDDYICLVIARYTACGTNKNHCSAPPKVIEFVRAQCELFGSPINTCLTQYCSAFPDIEHVFGSLGSFFEFEFRTGIYFMNPPYDEELMESAMNKIMRAMETEVEITVIAVIPVWDAESQEEFRGRVHVEKDYTTFNIVKGSQYLRSHTILDFRQHYFYNYYMDKSMPVADAHLLVISNTDYYFTATEIAKKWVDFVQGKSDYP